MKAIISWPSGQIEFKDVEKCTDNSDYDYASFTVKNGKKYASGYSTDVVFADTEENRRIAFDLQTLDADIDKLEKRAIALRKTLQPI